MGVSLGQDARIVHVSHAYRGGVADINISRAELVPKLLPGEFVLMDKGYQDDAEPRFLSPIKKRPVGGRPLDASEIGLNAAINRHRQIIERVNMRIKNFRCFKMCWRHDVDLHEVCFEVTCKMLNLIFEFEPLNQPLNQQ